MPNFIYDLTDLPYPKEDLVPIPPGTDEKRYLPAAHWNNSMEALYDVRGAIRNGNFHGLTRREVDPAPSDSGAYWWLDNSHVMHISRVSSLEVSGTIRASDPTGPYEVATKRYVDGLVNGLSWKAAVAVATTTNITLSGEQSIDGVSCVTGDRVLVKNQTDGTQNGIYIVNTDAWTRADDLAVGTHAANAAVFVDRGETNSNTAWVCSNDRSSDVVGTDALTFLRFSQLSIPQFTMGSIVVAGTDGELSEDHDNLYWDWTNKRLGAGTTSPSHPLTITSAGIAETYGTLKSQLSIKDPSESGPISGISFYGKISSTDSRCFGGLHWGKENSESGDPRAYMALYVSSSSALTARMYVNSNGAVGFGTTSPTATLHIGNDGSGYAPLKLDARTLLTGPEVGAIEFDGTTYYGTTSSGRSAFAFVEDVTLQQAYEGGQTITLDPSRGKIEFIRPDPIGEQPGMEGLFTIRRASGDALFDVRNTGVYLGSSGCSVFIREASGTVLQVGSINDNQFLVRSGSYIVSIPTSSIDHGSLSGLGDDDHPQYFLADGSRNLAGDLTFSGGDRYVSGAKGADNAPGYAAIVRGGEGGWSSDPETGTRGGNLVLRGGVPFGGGAKGYVLLGDDGSRVGIGSGMTSPESWLHAVDGVEPILIDFCTDSPPGGVRLRRSRGSLTSKQVVQTGDVLAEIDTAGYDGSTWTTAGKLEWIATGTVGSSRVPSYLSFYTATDASPSVLTEALRIGADQSVNLLGHVLYGGTSSSSALILQSTSGSSSSDYIAFRVGGPTEVARFASSGYLGLGTTSPVQRLDVAGNIRMDRIAAPTSPPTATDYDVGNVTGTNIQYTVTFVDQFGGETEAFCNITSPPLSVTNRKIRLTNIPTGPTGVVARRIYRMSGPAVPAMWYGYATKLVVTLNDNTTTEYYDNIPDASLGAQAPSINTTGCLVYGGSVRVQGGGTYSSAFGDYAMDSKCGYNCIAVGSSALRNSLRCACMIAIGTDAGRAATDGAHTTIIGYNAASGQTDVGVNNLIIGANTCWYPGYSSTIGNDNTVIGPGAHNSGLSGSSNVTIGRAAGARVVGMSYSTCIGSYAGYGVTTPTTGVARIVAIGYRAGFSIANSQTDCIFLGHKAGYYETASNKLYVDVSDTSTPLIYGDFASRYLRFHTPNVGTSQTEGVSIVNSTAAALGANQNSPLLTLRGQGWDYAGSQSVSVEWAWQCQPVANGVPLADLVLYQKIGASSYCTVQQIRSSPITSSVYFMFGSPSVAAGNVYLRAAGEPQGGAPGASLWIDGGIGVGTPGSVFVGYSSGAVGICGASGSLGFFESTPAQKQILPANYTLSDLVNALASYGLIGVGS